LRSPGIKRFEDQLSQPTSPRQLAAKRAYRVTTWQLVVAKGPEQQQRVGVDRTGQVSQQLRRSVVRPLKIIQKQSRRTARGDHYQRLPDCLKEGGTITA
jgi:hypothetical protein